MSTLLRFSCRFYNLLFCIDIDSHQNQLINREMNERKRSNIQLTIAIEKRFSLRFAIMYVTYQHLITVSNLIQVNFLEWCVQHKKIWHETQGENNNVHVLLLLMFIWPLLSLSDLSPLSFSPRENKCRCVETRKLIMKLEASSDFFLPLAKSQWGRDAEKEINLEHLQMTVYMMLRSAIWCYDPSSCYALYLVYHSRMTKMTSKMHTWLAFLVEGSLLPFLQAYSFLSPR